MVTYRYECRKCATVSDYEVPHMGDKPQGCYTCGSPDIARTFSGESIHFGRRSSQPGGLETLSEQKVLVVNELPGGLVVQSGTVTTCRIIEKKEIN